MKGFLALGTSLAVLGFSVTATEAATVTRLIDNFNLPTPDETGVFLDRSAGHTFATETQTGLSNVVGGSREISMQYVSSGTSASFPFATVTPAPSGFLTISNDTGTAAVDTDTTIIWDRNGVGLGDLDYDSLDTPRFVIDLLGSSVPINTTLTVIVETQGMGTTQAFQTITAGQNPFTPVIIPFSSFSQPGLLGNPFQSISLQVTGDSGHSIIIDQVFVEGETIVNPSVPEPSLAIGLLGIACLGISTRISKEQ
jgi:hypothetical protein